MNRVFAITGNGAEKNPDQGPIDDFWNKAINCIPTLSGDHQVRTIGIDEETTGLIINFIKAGEKVGTFSLPWIMTAENLPMSYKGLPIILLSYDGNPELVVQLTKVFETSFGNIDAEVTSIDGPPVRDPDVWIPLHRNYWNGILKDYGISCTDDMPVLVEEFKLVFPNSTD
jgi:uncharacterized protein YhfF